MITDEFAEQLTEGEARELTNQIRVSVHELLPLIRTAYRRRADLALGYAAWIDYCDAELSGLRLSVGDRQDAVAVLRADGMSQRAIGAAVGVSREQVRRDLADASPSMSPQVTPNVSPEAGASSPRINGTDGKTYPATKPKPAGPKSTSDTQPRSQETPVVPKPAEDEQVARQRSERVAEALVSLWGQLGDDPATWLAQTWRADAYRQRDMPKVRDVFTPAGLRRIATTLTVLADDLDQKGATL